MRAIAHQNVELLISSPTPSFLPQPPVCVPCRPVATNSARPLLSFFIRLSGENIKKGSSTNQSLERPTLYI